MPISSTEKSSSAISARVLIDHDPYAKAGDDEKIKSWQRTGRWPCRWIHGGSAIEPPFVTIYRHRFHLEQPEEIRVHLTADERYLLRLDGKTIGRGSERGEPNHWFFETYDLRIPAGDHWLSTLVWSQGEKRAYAQMSVSPGFLLSPQEEEFQKLIGTGLAPWEFKRMEGITFTDPMAAWGTGQNSVIDGAKFDWDPLSAESSGWQSAQPGHWGQNAHAYAEADERQHLLVPAVLPSMMEEERLLGRVRHVSELKPLTFPIVTAPKPLRECEHQPELAGSLNALFSAGKPVTVPVNSAWRIILDLEDYYCAYPRLAVSGGTGALVRIHWQEALLENLESTRKGDRDQVEGKFFGTIWWKCDGVGDSFKLDGGRGRVYEPLWWQAGRYVEIVVVTESEELVLQRLSFVETRYPMKNESSIQTSRKNLDALVPIFARSLHVCSHETYVDCPFYEQLCYAGDSRLDSLITYTTTADARLPRKTLQLFDWSRIQSGLTQSRFPSKVRQIIPPFSLWWICMVHDYALWRGDIAFIRSLMPGVRAVLEAYRAFQNESGTVSGVPGWNFVDWVPSWDGAPSAEGEFIANGSINWQLVLASRYAAELEDWAGDPVIGQRQRHWSKNLAAAIHRKYWNRNRGLYAENADQTVFSSHAQALALISGLAPAENRERMADALLDDKSLVPTTIYFRHYLFEGLCAADRGGEVTSLLNEWLDLPQLGFKTTYETDPTTTRSDCHAWGAHPLYHYFATLAGIRPAGFGFDEITISPGLEQLGWVQGEMPHPRGMIRFRFEQDAQSLSGRLELPTGIAATVHFARAQVRLDSSSDFNLQRKSTNKIKRELTSALG